MKGKNRKVIMKHSPIYRFFKNILWDIFLYRHEDRVRWIKSWFFNVSAVGVKNSFKMPIYIYDIDVISVPHFKFMCPIKRGLVKIGKPNDLAFSKGSIGGNGTIIIHGQCTFYAGDKLELGSSGILEIGNGVSLSANILLRCIENVYLEDDVRVGFYSQISDTDGHYIYDKIRGSVHKHTGKIRIGKATWIGANTKIMKNTYLPPHSIVANSSLVNKDYSATAPMTIFAGIPAKAIKEGYARIIDTETEHKLRMYFNSSEEENVNINNIINNVEYACRL